MKPTIIGIAVALMMTGSALAQTNERPPADPLAVNPIPSQAKTEDTTTIRTKIERAGYTEIAELARDSVGVWHARAKKGGDTVEVMVDKGGRIKAEPR
jgi:hypothetical protein